MVFSLMFRLMENGMGRLFYLSVLLLIAGTTASGLKQQPTGPAIRLFVGTAPGEHAGWPGPESGGGAYIKDVSVPTLTPYLVKVMLSRNLALFSLFAL